MGSSSSRTGSFRTTYTEGTEEQFCNYIRAHPDFFQEEDVTQDHVARTMFRCLLNKRVDLFLTVLQRAPELIRRRNSRGDFLLHMYCHHHPQKSLELLHVLVHQYPESLSIPNHEGRLPLQLTIQKWDTQSTQYILQRQNELDIPLDPTVPWLLLCCRQDMPLELVSPIFNMVPGNASVSDRFGNYALHSFFHSSSSTSSNLCVRFLARVLDDYPGAAAMPIADGCLPIHLEAKLASRPDSLNLLMQVYPEGLRTRDDKSMLPIHYALRYVAFTRSDDDDDDSIPVDGIRVLNALLDPSGCREMSKADGRQAVNSILLGVPQTAADRHHHNVNIKFDWLYTNFPTLIRQADDELGQLPLHVVCSHALIGRSSIDNLSVRYPEAWTTFDKDGYLPFHRCCMKQVGRVHCFFNRTNHDDTKRILYVAGKQPGSILPLTKDGTPSLFVACEFLPASDHCHDHGALDAIFELTRLSCDLFVHTM